jgi:hypothetical protein
MKQGDFETGVQDSAWEANEIGGIHLLRVDCVIQSKDSGGKPMGTLPTL